MLFPIFKTLNSPPLLFGCLFNDKISLTVKMAYISIISAFSCKLSKREKVELQVSYLNHFQKSGLNRIFILRKRLLGKRGMTFLRGGAAFFTKVYKQKCFSMS